VLQKKIGYRDGIVATGNSSFSLLLFSISLNAPGSHANPQQRQALHALHGDRQELEDPCPAISMPCHIPRSALLCAQNSQVTLPQILLTALSGIHNLRFWRFCSSNALASLLYLGNMGGRKTDTRGRLTGVQGLGRDRRWEGEGKVGTLGPAL
jgi:hypothetical protein